MPRLTIENEEPAVDSRQGQGALWLRCRSGTITGLISHSAVASIHRREQWDPAAGGLAGWLRLPAARVPIYHLAGLLGQATAGSQPRTALLVRAADPAFAIGVETLSRFSLPADTRLSALPWVLRRRVRRAVAGIAGTGGELAICLDATLLNPQAPPETGGGGETRAEADRAVAGPAPGSAVTPGAVGKLLAFHLPARVAGGKTPLIGLSFLQVLEVAERLPYLALPGSTEEMPGIVWWRNHPVPLVDLTYCLGGEPRPYGGGTILVARGSKSAGALAIPAGDEVSGMPMSVACSTCAEPFRPRVDCLRGEFDLGWERLLIPDLDSFFR